MQCDNVIDRALLFRLQLRGFRAFENHNKVIVGVVVVVALGKVSFYVSAWDSFSETLNSTESNLVPRILS